MKTVRVYVWLAAFLVFAPLARPTTVIYPVEAIDDLWALGAEDFKQRYGGINISGLGPSDEGWYVRYRHGNLTYLFGPLADREAARAKKWDMEAVRDAAIRNRQSLSSSSVDFVRFTFSGVFGRAGDGSGRGGEGPPRISEDGRSGPDGDLDGDGIPNSLDDDMDGDGIPNSQDPDMDGDGIPNEQDDYMYGTNPAGAKGGNGNMAGGNGEKQGGQAGGDGDKLAGKDGNSKGGDANGGEKGNAQGQKGSSQGGQKQVASNQQGSRGSKAGQQGRQSGQQGSQSGQQSQSSQSGQQSQSSSSSAGGPPSPPTGSSGASGNPLSLVGALLRMILGI